MRDAASPPRSLMQRFDAVALPLPVLLRVFLGGYFVNAGINKLEDPFVFLKAVRLYHMLPETPAIFINATAVVLPWLEVICGTALVLGLFRRGAATIIAAMLAVFTPAIFLRALAMMKSDGIPFTEVAFDCGCGTGADIIWIKLSQNVGLFLLAVITILSRCRRFSLAVLLHRRRREALTQPV